MKQLQRISKLFAFAACIALALFPSCNEDKGNYDYLDINTLDVIDNIQSSYSVDVGDLLEITPRLEFSHGEEHGDFTYKWYYKSDSKYVLLQEGLTFSHEIAPPIGKSVTMVFEAFNTQSQVYYLKVFNLEVGNPKGYAAIVELDDGFDIDLVAYSPSRNTFNLSKNVLVESAIPRKGVKPIDIVTATGTVTDNLSPTLANPDGTRYTVWILTDKYTTRVSAKDFSWSEDYNVESSVEKGSYLDVNYVQTGKPIVFQKMRITDHQGYQTWMYMDDNGERNWFLYQLHSPYRFLSNPINIGSKQDERGDIADVSTRFEPSPYAYIFNNIGALFYDQVNKSFKYTRVYTQNTFTWYGYYYCEPLGTETAEGQFSFFDPQFEDLIYMGEMSRTATVNDGVAIMKLKDNAGYRCLQFSGGTSAAGIAAASSRKRTSFFPAGSAIANMKLLATYPDYPGSPFIYYVTNDNKVWRADVSSPTAVETEVTSTFVKGGYTEITAFKFLLPQSQGSADCPASLERGLAVATYDASKGKAEGGKLEIFTLKSSLSGEMEVAKLPSDDDLTEGQQQITMSFEGMGKIVGLDYKKK
jgi:hypothetical protein